MSSMRDAMRRLDVIYQACAPEAIAAATQDKGLDEFQKLKKKINRDVKDVRLALRLREGLLSAGTSAEGAEASYKVRMLLKSLKDDITKMTAIYTKDEKPNLLGKRKFDDEELMKRKEVLTLCQQHVAECDELENRRFAEKMGADRNELMFDATGSAKSTGNGNAGEEVNENRKALFEGATSKKRKKGKKEVANDPFKSELPDIETEEDFRQMRQNQDELDKDLNEIHSGVQRLKEIALDMNTELDEQNNKLNTIEKKVDGALDDIDNINVKMKNSLDRVMKGDRFILNCILVCIILALVAFISKVATS